MATFDDLVKPITQGEYFNDLMNKHKANGVPTTAWLSTVNVGLSLTQINAQLFADLRESVRNIGQSMFLDYASGAGLTLFAKSFFNIDRQPAQIAKGTVRLISSASAPAYSFAIGDLTIGTRGSASAQKLYTNATAITLAAGAGTADVLFQAVEAGTSYNIANTTPMDLKTSLIGVSVSNPIYPIAPDWINQYGTDGETDESLKERCLAKWSTIGAECNTEAMVFFAKEIPAGYLSSPVTQVRVMENWRTTSLYTGYFPGHVTVIVGQEGGNGQLAPADLAAVAANFENPTKYGIGRTLFVINMEFVDVPVSGTINVYKTAGLSLDQIKLQVAASLADFQTLIKIGQAVYPQKIAARIEDGNKLVIRNVQLTSPSNFVQPLFYQRIRLLTTPTSLIYNLV